MTDLIKLTRDPDDAPGGYAKVFAFLRERGLDRETLIVFTSDHGDYLGDHWLGEKEQFYDTVQNIPLIVYDPSPQADATRGTAHDSPGQRGRRGPDGAGCAGAAAADHRVEGRSLLDLTRAAARDGAGAWRDAVVSELDYAYRGARVALGRHPGECRAWMVRDARWKYVHWQGFRPQLFDLHNDPQEYFDLGADPGEIARALGADRCCARSCARVRACAYRAPGIRSRSRCGSYWASR